MIVIEAEDHEVEFIDVCLEAMDIEMISGKKKPGHYSITFQDGKNTQRMRELLESYGFKYNGLAKPSVHEFTKRY